MSKHPSDNTKRNLLRRSLAGILTLALILGLLPGTLITASAASWADPYVQTLTEWGVMRGDIGGNMDPDRNITRAEFVTMMNRAYGYTNLGGHPFTDVRSRDWYNQDIDIAYNIGYFKGTGPTTASPNDTLTREQAAVLLARNMMMQETVGETLGFSDTRTLSDWSRGLVGAAAANGIIGGYEDGSFQPMQNITRGEVAAMLVRAIGIPIQSAGDHTLGNVYGNVTVNTSGVRLRDGVIAGNLYLTGGIDLGDVLLENVTVLGEIIVSGGGESNSSQSSIILRNVVADNMVVDSIGNQFVTVRAEGNTDIPTTFVRTSAYVDDFSLPGYGLSFITLDGEEGAMYQLAGNVKEVLNKTPGSDLQIVQGTANKVTVDEHATGSKVLVDGDAVVGSLNLDVATGVTGTGDIKNLNVGAAGSTVERLPDSIDIRPGITADINGSQMNSSQAAESSAAPKLLAGYPAVRKIAPTNAELVFRTNKTGTIYWAVSAVSDGSVSEADLLEPPVYGKKVLASGKVTANAANTDYTARVNGLTTGGSYYVTAMLVDGRNQHSPIKVTSFTTPDSTVPAFATGYPVMSKITCDDAQVTVMTTKSCLLYYALLPAGTTAPTTAEFKAAAIPGNLGYGSMSVTKNVTIPFPVNDGPLDEKTNYVLYLWLTDHDGAQSAPSVTRLPFTTPDETPPIVTDIRQTNQTASSITVEYSINERADFVWAIVTEGNHISKEFLSYEWTEDFEPGSDVKSTLKFNSEADLLAAKVQLMSGVGALANGTSNRNTATINNNRLSYLNAKTSSFVLYYIADDNATASGNLSTQIKALRVHTLDEIDPTVELRFNSDGGDVKEFPLAGSDVRIIFSESVKGTTAKGQDIFLKLYEDMTKAEDTMKRNGKDGDKNSDEWKDFNTKKNLMANTLAKYITFHDKHSPTKSPTELGVVPLEEGETPPPTGPWIDWHNAEVKMLDDGSGRVEIFLRGTSSATAEKPAAIQLDCGHEYHFRLESIYDLATPPRALGSPYFLDFTTKDAQVNLVPGVNLSTMKSAITVDSNGNKLSDYDLTGTPSNPGNLVDYHFKAFPKDVERTDADLVWDMLIWFMNFSVEASIYYRYIDENGKPVNLDGTYGATDDDVPWILATDGVSIPANGFTSMAKNVWKSTPDYTKLSRMMDQMSPNGKARSERKEYVVHLNRLGSETNRSSWNRDKVVMRVSVVTGNMRQVSPLAGSTGGSTGEAYDRNVGGENQARSIEKESPFTISRDFNDDQVPEINTDVGISLNQRNATSATITLRLKGPGHVDCLAIPVGSIYDPNKTDVLLGDKDEGLLVQVKNAYTPRIEIRAKDAAADTYPDLGLIPLMKLDANRVKDSKNVGDAGAIDEVEVPSISDFDESERGRYEGLGVKMVSSNVGERTGDLLTISLTGLDANTVYILCLLPSGLTAAPDDSTKITCVRFTTSKEDTPKLELGGTRQPNIDVNVETGNSAYMYWYLILRDNLDAKFSDPFSKIARDDCPEDYKDGSENTVLWAMREKVNRDGSFQGSVFDLYAREEAKDSYRDLILDSSSGAEQNQNSIAGGSGNNPVYLNNKTTLQLGSETNMLGGQTPYVLIAMAKRTMTSTSYSFAAWSPVTKDEEEMPVLQTAVMTGTHKQMKDKDGNYTGVESAEITLTFSGPLYAWNGSKGYPLDNCAGGTGKHSINPDSYHNSDEGSEKGDGGDYYCLGLAVDTSSFVSVKTIKSDKSEYHYDKTNGWQGPISSIVLKIDKLPANGTGYIRFGTYTLTSEHGKGADRASDKLSFTIKAVKSTDEKYYPVITSTPSTSSNNSKGWVAPGSDWNLTTVDIYVPPAPEPVNPNPNPNPAS